MGTSEHPSADGITVLHVDDEPRFAELVAAFLERENGRSRSKRRRAPTRVSSVSATSADEGLQRLGDEDDVDCIVSDYDMPGTNGIEFLRTVRVDHTELTFILFTGKGSEEVAIDAVSADVTDYLQKKTGTEQYELLANRVGNAVDRQRAERGVRRALRAIETDWDGISLLDGAGEFIYVNEAYAETLGYGSGEMVGMHWEALYPEEALPHLYDTVLPAARDGRWQGRHVVLRKDGSELPVDHALTYAEDGSLVCTLSSADDETALAEALSRRERAMDEAPIGIIISDPSREDNPIVYANAEFEAMTGYDESGVLGRNCRLLQGPETSERTAAEMRAAVDAGEPVTVDVRNYRKDGTPFWNRVWIEPLRDEGGEVGRFVGFQRDVTGERDDGSEH